MADKKREWTKDELVKAFTEFKEATLYISQNIDTWNNIVVDCDKAFGDIRHYCEFAYPKKRSDKTRVCRFIHEYSVKRRTYKDLIHVAKPIQDFMENEMGKAKRDKLYAAVREAEKINGQTVPGARHYVPRIINELFETEEEDTHD